MEMLFTGRRLDAEEAARWGFVNEVVPADRLMERAREKARLLAEGPPLVFAAIKEVLRETEGMRFQDAISRMNREEFATIRTLYHSEDQKEGARAFAEKRKPQWQGR